MDDMEEKLGAILGNQQMMAQIMAMAQNLNQSSAPPRQEGKTQDSGGQSQAAGAGAAENSSGGMDFAAIQKIAGFARQTAVDPNQKALLTALHPYLSTQRIVKLEKAMRAAKIAGIASSFLSGSGILNKAGR